MNKHKKRTSRAHQLYTSSPRQYFALSAMLACALLIAINVSTLSGFVPIYSMLLPFLALAGNWALTLWWRMADKRQVAKNQEVSTLLSTDLKQQYREKAQEEVFWDWFNGDAPSMKALQWVGVFNRSPHLVADATDPLILANDVELTWPLLDCLGDLTADQRRILEWYQAATHIIDKQLTGEPTVEQLAIANKGLPELADSCQQQLALLQKKVTHYANRTMHLEIEAAKAVLRSPMK